MSALNDMTNVIEQHPETLEEIRQLVRASAGSDDEFRAHTLGQEIGNLVAASATGAAQAVLKQFLEQIDSEELGRWYIACFDFDAWPMWQWADAGSVDEEGREQMRADLLEVRDRLRLSFPDEEAVFDYLADGENALTDDDGDEQEFTAWEVGRLWERRYQTTYQSWTERAQFWAVNDAMEYVDYLYGVATSEQKRALDELQAQLGESLAKGDEDLCYLDRRSSGGGGILCLKRRDD